MELITNGRYFLTENKSHLKTTMFFLLVIMAGALAGAALSGFPNFYYIAAALALPVIIVAAIKKPFVFALGAYAFLLPFNTLLGISNDGPWGTVTKYVGIMCIVALLLNGVVEHRLVKPYRAAVWWPVFMALALATLLWAPVPLDKDYFSAVINHLGLFLLYLAACVYSPTEKDMNNLKSAILYGGVIAALYNIVSYYIQGPNAGGRATLVYGDVNSDPNELVFSLSFSFAVGLSYFYISKRWTARVLALLFLGILAYALVLTGSRGGVIGFISIALAFIYYSPRKVRLALGFIAVSAAAVYLAPELFFDRILTAYQSGGAGRVDIWQVGLEAFKHYWLFGAGLDSFAAVYGQFSYGLTDYYLAGPKVAHNIFLQVGVEFGVVGLAIMLAAFVKHYRYIRDIAVNLNDESVWLGACLIGTFAQGMFLGILWNKSFWLLWILIALYGNFAATRGQALSPRHSAASSRGRNR